MECLVIGTSMVAILQDAPSFLNEPNSFCAGIDVYLCQCRRLLSIRTSRGTLMTRRQPKGQLASGEELSYPSCGYIEDVERPHASDLNEGLSHGPC